MTDVYDGILLVVPVGSMQQPRANTLAWTSKLVRARATCVSRGRQEKGSTPAGTQIQIHQTRTAAKQPFFGPVPTLLDSVILPSFLAILLNNLLSLLLPAT